MDELAKINRVIDRELPDASKEKLLVLDSTTGQNAVNQAEQFRQATGITGIDLIFALSNIYPLLPSADGLSRLPE